MPLSEGDLQRAIADLRELPGVEAGLIHLESGFEGLAAVRFTRDSRSGLREEELAVVDSLRARAPDGDELTQYLLADGAANAGDQDGNAAPSISRA